MGKATELARFNLHCNPDQKFQQAAVVVRDPTSTKYFEGLANYNYSETGKSHVEKILFEILYEHYSQFKSLPNNATIIIAGKWSPCKKCTTETIPEFIKDAKLFERGIKLKFRFDTYYTQKEWTDHGGKVKELGIPFFWETNERAQDTYDKLTLAYGINKTVYLGEQAEFDMFGRFLDVSRFEKLKYNLVFAPSSFVRTSRIVKY